MFGWSTFRWFPFPQWHLVCVCFFVWCLCCYYVCCTIAIIANAKNNASAPFRNWKANSPMAHDLTAIQRQPPRHASPFFFLSRCDQPTTHGRMAKLIGEQALEDTTLHGYFQQIYILGTAIWREKNNRRQMETQVFRYTAACIHTD